MREYRNSDDLPQKLKFNPIEIDWKNRLKNNWWAINYSGERSDKEKALFVLIEHLLGFGDEEACMAFGESPQELADLLEQGIFMYGDDVDLLLGEPCNCHENARNLAIENPDKYRMMTGYALSEDGMWRQHSWCLNNKNNQVVETTKYRIGYYGVKVEL